MLEQGLSQEVHSFFSGKDIPTFYGNQNIHCCYHKCPPSFRYPESDKSRQRHTMLYLKFHFNINSPSQSRSCMWSLSFRFQHHKNVCFASPSCVPRDQPILWQKFNEIRGCRNWVLTAMCNRMSCRWSPVELCFVHSTVLLTPAINLVPCSSSFFVTSGLLRIISGCLSWT